MIFDGLRWTRSRTVVALPHDMWEGDSKNYATFGRACKRSAPGAVKTHWKWNGIPPSHLWENGVPEPDEIKEGKRVWYVWALPIKSDGHSLTNLMYGKDGNSYLLHKGRVYVRGKDASMRICRGKRR